MRIAIVNQKGGVGKTTVSLNLSYALGKLGKNVLAVDFDPQASLTISLGYNPNEMENTVYSLILGESNFENTVIRTEFGFDLLPSNIDLAAAEILFASRIGREKLLRKVLEGLSYDFIIIDSQPSLSLLTVNALTASDGVLIPISCQYLSLKGFEFLLKTIKEVKENVNEGLEVLGVVPTFYDPRTKHSREVLNYLRKEVGKHFKIFPPIRKTVRIDDSLYENRPIFFFRDKLSKRISSTFLKIAKEVISYGKTSRD